MSKTTYKPGQSVMCFDNNYFDLSHYVGKYIAGVRMDGSQRLFTRTGHYAGADRTKNIAKVIDE